MRGAWRGASGVSEGEGGGDKREAALMGEGHGDEGDDLRLKEKSSRGGVPVPREKRHASAETETHTLGCPVMSLRTFTKHNNRKRL